MPSEKMLFSGDTLFQESIGRTDLPGGDMHTLLSSLQRLTVLPPDTQVLPGHGYPTTIAHEIEHNPYLH
jgi:glyoxylase-like metal-dependent hydrolase (beta-lactamase superfamily II)